MSFLYRRCNNQSFTDCILEELHLVKVVVKTMYRKIRNKSRSELKAAPDYRPHQIAKSIQYKPLSIINHIELGSMKVALGDGEKTYKKTVFQQG